MQVELRNKVAERKRKEEEYWHKKTMEDIAKGLEEEKRKEEGIKLRAQQAKAVQMAQLEEMRQAYVAMKIDEKEEGLLTKLQSQKAAQEAGEKEEARLKAEKERTHTTQAENKRMLAEKARKDAEDAKKESEKMKFFAAEKERKMALRAERAAEINRIKQEMKQRMIDKQVRAPRTSFGNRTRKCFQIKSCYISSRIISPPRCPGRVPRQPPHQRRAASRRPDQRG